MKLQTVKNLSAAGLLAAAPMASAHPALFEGGPLQTLVHQLTEPDHLLMLAGIVLVIGIAIRLVKRA